MKIYTKFTDMVRDARLGLLPMCIAQTTAFQQMAICGEDALAMSCSLADMDGLVASEGFYDDFDLSLGGNIFLAETEEDLQEFVGFSSEVNCGRNATEAPMAWDVCAYALEDKASGWFLFCLVANNAGGSTYYVPEKLWVAARVEEHLKFHQEYWNSCVPVSVRPLY